MSNLEKIDFFILEDADEQKALRFSCELIEKKYLGGDFIYIHTASQKQAEKLNILLWTFKDVSFIPHIFSDQKETNIPVQIGFNGTQPIARARSIVNLNAEIPPFTKECQRIFEIVSANPEVQQWARERYRRYREQTNHINIHKIKCHEDERVLNEFH